MNLEAANDALQEAADAAATVTITTADGRILTGVPRPHPTLPEHFTIRTGRRGRPAVVDAFDVEDITNE